MRLHPAHAVFAGSAFLANLVLVWPVLSGSGHLNPAVGFPGSEAEGVPGAVVPLLVRGLSALGLSPERAAAALTALAFAAIAPGIGILAWYLTRRHLAGWLAALVVTVVPSVVYLAQPLLGPLTAAPFSAPGPFLAAASAHTAQVVALALLPWAAITVLAAVHTGGRRRILVAAAVAAVVLLTGIAAATSLALLGVAVLGAEVLRTKSTAGVRIRRAVGIGLLALAFAAPWYTPAFWTEFWTRGAGAAVVRVDLGYIPFVVVLAPWLLIGAFSAFGFRRHAEPLLVSVGWFTLLAAAVGAGVAGGRDVVPFAARLLPEFDLAVALCAGVLGTAFFDWVGRAGGAQHRLTRVFQGSLLFGLFLSLVGYTAGFWRGAPGFLRTLPAGAPIPTSLDLGRSGFQVSLGVAIAAVALMLTLLPRRPERVLPPPKTGA